MEGYLVYDSTRKMTLNSKWNWEKVSGMSETFTSEELAELRATDIGDWVDIQPAYVRKAWTVGMGRVLGFLEPFWIETE